MQTLDAPVYEVRKDSEWYKDTIAIQERQREFFKEINSKYVKENSFVFWHSEYFGILGSSSDYETYQDEFKKHPVESSEGPVYIFKKRSKHFPIFREMINRIGYDNPFRHIDILGLNNRTSSHWVGKRWFYSVKNAELIPKESLGKHIDPVNYKEYLEIVLNHIKEEGQ